MIPFGAASAEKASEAYEKGQYRVAYKHYRRLAKRGDGRAARLLGDMHRDGEGVKQDISTAMKWYSMAAGMGDDPACRILGRSGDGVRVVREISRPSAGAEDAAVQNARDWVAFRTTSPPQAQDGDSPSGADRTQGGPAKRVFPTERPVGLLGRGLRLIRALAARGAETPRVRSGEVRHELITPKAPIVEKAPAAPSYPVEELKKRDVDPELPDTGCFVDDVRGPTNVSSESVVDETSVGEESVEAASDDMNEGLTVEASVEDSEDWCEVVSPEDPVLMHSVTESHPSRTATLENDQGDRVGDDLAEEVIETAGDLDGSDTPGKLPESGVPREIRLDGPERDLLSQLDTDHLLGKAEAGDVEAMLEVAAAYRVGLGVDKDVEAAANWYRRAATEGNGEAQFQLGRMFLKGTGVRRNRRHAFSWLRRAAIGGHPRAPFELGLQFAERSRSISDLINAVAWLTMAYEAGHLSALDMRETVATELSDDHLTEAGRVADGIRDDMQRAANDQAAA